MLDFEIPARRHFASYDVTGLSLLLHNSLLLVTSFPGFLSARSWGGRREPGSNFCKTGTNT